MSWIKAIEPLQLQGVNITPVLESVVLSRQIRQVTSVEAEIDSLSDIVEAEEFEEDCEREISRVSMF